MTTPCTCQHLTSETARADGNGDLLTAERAESARLQAAMLPSPQILMGLHCELRASLTDDANVRTELWAEVGGPRRVIRITDLDAGRTVGLTTYPDPVAGRDAFTLALECAA